MSTPASATIVSITRGRRRNISAIDGEGAATATKIGPIKWLAAFETGNAEIDALHRRLVHGCNSLQAILADGVDWSRVVAETRKLIVDCIEHFRIEQAVLERVKFPRLREHLTEHRRMEDELRAILGRMVQVDGSAPEHREIPASLVPTVIDLMIRHDLDYRSHILFIQGR